MKSTQKMRAAALIFILLFISFHLNANTLQIKRVARINSEVIMVKDLLESFDGDEHILQDIEHIAVAVLPFEKRMINISSNVVQQKIQAQFHHLNIRIPSTICAVRWEELTLDVSILKNEAETFLQRQYNLSPAATMTFQNVPSIVIPAENIILSFETSRSTANTQYTKLTGKIEYKRNIVSVFSLNVKIEDTQTVYQANRSIKKGEQICLSDLTQTEAKINPINILLTDLDDTDHYIANNFISKGSYLRNTDIVSTPDIKSNDTVTVLVQTKSMLMSYQAISRGNGWLGDRIMLQNPDSKQIFYAEVIDKNKVKINLED